MFSSPDTSTFFGSKCITESSAGWFLMAHSRCDSSTGFRRLLSAKKETGNQVLMLSKGAMLTLRRDLDRHRPPPTHQKDRPLFSGLSGVLIFSQKQLDA